MTRIRLLEKIFVFYFITHIPITLFIDFQTILPGYLYPRALKDLLKWYSRVFKDSLLLHPPAWFKSFIVCEAALQTPFFPIAAYAFLKGSRHWIRTPAIIYSTHVSTTLIPILSHIIFHDYTVESPWGPETQQERWILVTIYAPYLFVPVLLLFTMLLSSTYNPGKFRKALPNEAKGKKMKCY
ncbi:sigma intracellular receptor 2 [Syngnathoides biaculeatus]|uniref:sigma intracellular receptor 2 n=1 Tax=Syngnathoides biaculeatus TaxID=300417 RepID=UPI002ADDFA9E|nr:sigma intracellular receptor 2 [Syngnathoides biaculeatus]